MKTMAEKNVTSAEAYYKAMNDKDAAGVARHLHPDVQFIGPMATLAGKTRFWKRLNGLCPKSRKSGFTLS
jgi:ketosteroid isomerase-like protein